MRRRNFLVTMGAGVVAATAFAGRRADAEAPRLLDAIRPGARVGRAEVMAVDGVHLGGIAVTLRDSAGARFQVDVLRRDARGPAGVARTGSLDLFLSNRGDGRTPSDEEHGLAAMALASALAQAEALGARAPRRLLTHRQRNARFPDGAFRARG